MVIVTVNPFTEHTIREYSEQGMKDITSKISEMKKAQANAKVDLDTRIAYFKDVLKRNLVDRERELAETMTREMGKPISQSISEVRKCQWLVDYAIENSQEFLRPEPITIEGSKVYVRYDSLGVVLLIMPWNFPLWQVLRAAIPAMAAGNGVVLKHASIVTGSSLLLEEVMNSPLFRSLVIPGELALDAIAQVDAVSFTGSSDVGAIIAERAGRELKKTVLELGGSDPFIVLDSADLEATAKQACFARLQNGGQSCIASKRFIVQERVYQDFYRLLKEEFARIKMGDPMDETTFLGPLASKTQASTVKEQIRELGNIGEVDVIGQSRGNMVAPTIAKPEQGYGKEIFGPVAQLRKFKTEDEAVQLANETPFGLGSSIWGDPDKAESLVPRIEAGMVFVNKVVVSDPRVPFGGVKKSGFGRELSRFGFREFTNIKTVWVQGTH